MDHPGLCSIKREPIWHRFIVKPVFYALFPIIIPIRLTLTVILIGVSALIDILLNFNTD